MEPEKNKYQQAVKETIEKLQEQVDDLKQQSAKAGEDIRQAMNEDVADLQDKVVIAQTKYRNLETTGKASWRDLQISLDNAVDEIRNGLESAARRFSA